MEAGLSVANPPYWQAPAMVKGEFSPLPPRASQQQAGRQGGRILGAFRWALASQTRLFVCVHDK
jgi:hypothetical protein